MGIVVLQLGQGGNQFGFSFFNALADHSPSHHLPPDFFREASDGPPIARAVLVDMEPKLSQERPMQGADGDMEQGTLSHKIVAQEITGLEAFTGTAHVVEMPFSISSERRLVEVCSLILSLEPRSSGVGSNGPLKNLVRFWHMNSMTECCDTLGGFLTMQSIAGGTGSGLGAYLLDLLKDEYPNSLILSHCIWPFDTGEVAVQSYNILLSVAHLQELADAIIHVRNETLMATCKKMLSIQKPSFDDMNQVAAQAMTCVFLPAYARNLGCNDMSAVGPRLKLLSDTVSSLCSQSSYKMLALRFIPEISAKLVDFTTFKWESQLKQLRRMLYVDEPIDNNKRREVGIQRSIDRCISNLLILRGRNSFDADASLFTDKALYPSWSVDHLRVGVHPASFGKFEMAAGLLSNCQSAIAHASQPFSRASIMYTSKAYIFQYLQNGMEEAFFEDSFVTMQDILARYAAI